MLQIIHFPDWKEYNEMIGLGGWGDRNEKSVHMFITKMVSWLLIHQQELVDHMAEKGIPGKNPDN